MANIRRNLGIPSGVVFPFASATAPYGYLVCDGSAVSRTDYPQLFAAIGITHGQGDGSTTFNLPDYRGRFMRGVDGTAGIDPDKATRTAMATGGATGNNIGSVQGDGFASHNHAGSYYGQDGTSTGNGPYQTPVTAANAATVLGPSASAVVAQGGNETRPKNANVNYIIKY